MNPGLVEIGGKRYRIDRIVAVYQVWTMGELPFPTINVQVIERGAEDFQGLPDPVVRNPNSGELEHTCGLGSTADEALCDCIKYFFREVETASAVRPLTEDDFVWRVGGSWD